MSISRRSRRVWALGAAGTLAVGIVAAAAQTPALAVACSSPVKYAASSNTVYLLTAQTWTLSSIKAACSAAPLEQVDPVHHVWELRGDLVLNNGATLALHSTTAAAPGDVDVLRLRSLASNAATDVSVITAHWGTIDADGVHITSWDDAAAAPDTNVTLPAGAPAGSRARAYIRAQSFLDNGVGRVSSMTFTDSVVENLGWYAAEAYGLSWKSLGCSHAAADLATCAVAPVTGGATGSTFSKNYMGTYVWGGHALTFTGNLYTSNVMYGLDTHDVTTQMTVDHDHFSYNGDHGFICSQRCDHLTVTNNESDHNGMAPWAGPNPSGEAQGGQVHGIMLHRGITNTVVANNTVHDQPNGAGIAIFDTSGQTIRNNTVTRCLYGLRISVGSANNVFSGNTVTGSGKYGVYTYKGTDLPENSTASGHPTGNVFTGDTFASSGVAAVNLTETDGSSFTGNTFGGGAIRVSQSAGTRITGGIQTGQSIQASGSTAEPSDVKLVDPGQPASVTVSDASSKANITSASGRLFLVAAAAFAQTVTPAGSTLTLTTSKLGTTPATATVSPSPVTVAPSTSSVKASTAPGTSTKIYLTAATSGVPVAVTVGGLTPNGTYKISGGGVSSVTVTASAGGVVSFGRTLSSTAKTTFTVAPA